MKKTNFLLLILIMSFSIGSCSHKEGQKDKVTLLEFQDLDATKLLIKQKDKKALALYHQLLKEANSLLSSNSFSVTNKTGVPPSGDKHDYMSIGPYWWPNPKTHDALPYIRKDGEVNPETRNNFTDFMEVDRFFKSIKILRNAFYYSDNKTYAKKALVLIKAWFLDEATKMNPHLNYGQSIPGKNDGRPFGIIEFGGIKEVLECLEVLAYSDMLDMETDKGMRTWLSDYVNWLQTSENGIEEANALNNHGTHYDGQLLSIMIYLGEIDIVKNYLNTRSKNRIYSQIEVDGSQPRELKRTKSFSYSVMNLHGFLDLAILGKKVGVDFWNLKSSDGRSIKKGYEYLIPYVAKEKDWEYKQIIPMDKPMKNLKKDLKTINKEFNDDLIMRAIGCVNE